MGKAKALVVGVPDPTNPNWSADRLPGVEHDVADMTQFLKKLGFDTDYLLESDATARAVLSGIRAAADKLDTGDMFVFYYSGHGGQRLSQDADEAEDQILLTYGEEIVDDQLGALWPQFRKDVRIVVITDSCHSGSVVREIAPSRTIRASRRRARSIAPRASFLSIGLKDGQSGASRAGNIEGYQGTLIHMAACKDPEETPDIGTNGAFTDALLRAWDGEYRSSYYEIYRQTAYYMTNDGFQKPVMTAYGWDQPLFLEQKPFDFGAAWPL